MNKKPVSYLQYDKKWAKVPYQVKGETTDIQESGCGPTSAAMILSTMTGKKITPIETCKWSVDHGYKALKSGTYYGYFKPQFKSYGIECVQCLGSSIHNKPNHSIHNQVKQWLEEGYYIIALMGKGTWTKSGHFVVVYWWDDKVRINDPASTKTARLNGDPYTFKNEVKNYWRIDARKFNKGDEDEVTYEQWKKFMDQYRKELASMPAGMPDLLADAKLMGLTDGSRPRDLVTREEAAVMARAAAKK